ncbi:hypothetical protein M378DRAFT_166257 [Amanita muscaria Koide BX008]|uniref:Uncharacterized protein n=1 Tax=Amanita muscaria (strain Koide BX008) TaxID=946122 RepID=A0A0C2WK56_AMAMK|nr:hypothetical protein M378DRAFT_166257 [Amanita muscaria Koide BX008]
MMSVTIATTPYTSSTSVMFDAGRQPLATLHNTPEPKRSVKVRKHADVFFCPRAVNPWANLAQSPKDVPKPQNSVEVPPSTLKRVPRVKKCVGPKDSGDPDDEDLPLSRVKELMVKLGRRPAPIRLVPKHTLFRPATIPMTCIASNCPFDWHDHVDAAVSH